MREPPNDSDDEEREHGAEDEHGHLPMTLKSAFQKLKVLKLVTQHGVHHSQAQDWAKGDRYKKIRSADQEVFIREILRSAPLMQQSALALRSLQPHLSTEHADEAAEILDAATQALHRIKMCTAHTCWYEHVAHLKQEVTELSMKREEVLKQWKEARTSYLREISLLREQARLRGDPQELLSGHGADVEFFFEPTSTLEPEERKFLSGVLSEKLKMMMETNPQVVRTFDLGQLDKLMQQVESQECIDLRKALHRKTEEVAEAKKALQEWKSNSQHVAPLPQGDHASKLVGALEAQVQDLRSDVWEGRRALQQLQEKFGSVQAERDELEAAWREESNRSLLQQKELKRLEALRQQLQEELDTAEAERALLEGQLADAQRRMQRLARERTATRQLERSSTSRSSASQFDTGAPPSPRQLEGAASPRRARLSTQRSTIGSVTLELDTATPESPRAACSSPRGGGGSSRTATPKAASPKAEWVMKAHSFKMKAEASTGEAAEEGDARVARGSKPQLLPLEVEPVVELEEGEAPAGDAPSEGEAEQPPKPRPLPLDAAGSGEAPTEAIEEGHETLAEELQVALAGKKALEARCEELEALLRSHAEALPTQKAEVAHSDAENIAQFAECLGCVSSERTSDGVRVCSCGNLLMNDASFCRKCGSEWREGSGGTEAGGAAPGGRGSKDRILELGHRFAKLDEAHQLAVRQLDSALRPGQERGQRWKSAGGGKPAPGEVPSGRSAAAGRSPGGGEAAAGAEAGAAGRARAAGGARASLELLAARVTGAAGHDSTAGEEQGAGDMRPGDARAAGGEAPATGEAPSAGGATGAGQATAGSDAPTGAGQATAGSDAPAAGRPHAAGDAHAARGAPADGGGPPQGGALEAAATEATAAAVPAAVADSGAPVSKDVKWAPTVEELEEEVARLEREKSNTEAEILVELAEAALEENQVEPEDQNCSCRSAQHLGVLRQLLGKLRLLCNQLIGKLKSATLENVKMSNAMSTSRSLLEVAAKAVGESMGRRSGTRDRRLLEGLRAIEGSKSRCVFYRLYSDARQRERRPSGASRPRRASTVGEAPRKTPDGDQGAAAWLKSPEADRGGPPLTITQIAGAAPLTRRSRVSKTLPAALPAGWCERPSPQQPALTVQPLRPASPTVQSARGPSPPGDSSPAKSRAGERPSSRGGAAPGEPSSARARPSEPAVTSPRRPSNLAPMAHRQSIVRQRNSTRANDTRLPRLVTPRKESVAMDTLLVVSSTQGSRCATPCETLPEEPSEKK